MNLDKQTVLRACVALGPPIALAACLTFSQPAGAAHAAGPSQIQAEKPTMQGGYEVRSVWSIGGPDAPDAAQFYEKVGGVTFDSDSAGRLYVLDNGIMPDGSPRGAWDYDDEYLRWYCSSSGPGGGVFGW